MQQSYILILIKPKKCICKYTDFEQSNGINNYKPNSWVLIRNGQRAATKTKKFDSLIDHNIWKLSEIIKKKKERQI